MNERLPDRIARRRRELRRRQIRRRRITALSVLALIVAVPVFVIAGGGGGPDPTGTSNSPRGGSGPSTETVAGTDVPESKGAQPDSSWQPSEAPVPILMYHVIGDAADGAALPGLFLSVDNFTEQVDWLDENGYTAVTLVQVQDAWYDGGTLPEKPIVLSFDDGYLGQYLEAMPILAEHGWAGQLNLKAEGSDLSSKQVKKMIGAGWEIASHTITHPDLPSMDAATLETEVAGSKTELEEELGIEIVNFCYPAGKYDDAVVAAVEAAGYRGATTVDPGLADRDEPFTLKRIRIDQSYGSAELASLLGA